MNADLSIIIEECKALYKSGKSKADVVLWLAVEYPGLERKEVLEILIQALDMSEKGSSRYHHKYYKNNEKSSVTRVVSDRKHLSVKIPSTSLSRVVPEYLLNNKERITNIPVQNLGIWSIAYNDEVFSRFPVMLQLRREFPERIIYRKDIVKLFEEGRDYLGFVAAMVWGFINPTRPRVDGGDKTTTNLYRALAHPRKDVELAISQARSHFINGEYRIPFVDMKLGDGRIPGVGHSYFTKIFFFLGQACDEIIDKPLIFDKWTSNAFYALLSESYPEEVVKYFRAVKTTASGSPGEVVLRTGRHLTTAYLRFVELMNIWARSLGVSAGQLEQFVFGYSLKRGLLDNPRSELWSIVDRNSKLIAAPSR